MHQVYLLKGLSCSPHTTLPAASAWLLPLVGKYPESFASSSPDSATRLQQGERRFVLLGECESAAWMKMQVSGCSELCFRLQLPASSALASFCHPAYISFPFCILNKMYCIFSSPFHLFTVGPFFLSSGRS